MLSAEAWQRLGAQAVALCGFVSLNIGLNFFNSWILKAKEPWGFDFPIFFTTFTFIGTICGALVLMCINTPASGFPSFKQYWLYKEGLLPIATCTVLSLCLNNMSLALISLFLNQVIKACGPLPAMLFSFLIERKTYSLALIGACILIVGGTVLAVPMKSGGHQTSILGVVYVIVSMLATSLKPVLQGLAMKGTIEKPKLPPCAARPP